MLALSHDRKRHGSGGSHDIEQDMSCLSRMREKVYMRDLIYYLGELTHVPQHDNTQQTKTRKRILCLKPKATKLPILVIWVGSSQRRRRRTLLRRRETTLLRRGEPRKQKYAPSPSPSVRMYSLAN